MAIQQLQFQQPFLQATQKAPMQNYGSQINKYQGAENVLPKVSSGFPSTEDMELASRIAEGDLKVGNPFGTSAATSAHGAKGAAFEGFVVPQNNGTGELIPNVSDREDSIAGCPWEAYMA